MRSGPGLIRGLAVHEPAPWRDALRPVAWSAPPPADDEAVIAVEAVALTLADIRAAESLDGERGRALVPGRALAGRVLARSPAAGDLEPGERVAALVAEGGLSDRVVVPRANIVRVPATLPADAAAAGALLLATAYVALVVRGQVRARETVVLFGPGGALEFSCRALATALGARPVSPPAEGADAALDLGGGASAAAALRCVGPGGRVICLDAGGGAEARVPMRDLLARNATLAGADFDGAMASRPAEITAALGPLLRGVAAGRMDCGPWMPLAPRDIPQAGDLLHARPGGVVVVRRRLRHLGRALGD